MSSHHFDFGRVQAPAQHGPVVKQLSDIDPTVLIQIAAWLEQNPISVPWSRVRGVPPLLRAMVGEWTAANGGRTSTHFSASAVSDSTTVAHGLGITPALVLLNPEDNKLTHAVGVTGSTNFACTFRDTTGSRSGDVVFDWLALG